MNQPLVTISIPTYNSEAFLARCLEALKNQTYKNIEINIIDGISKDKTVQIATELGVTNIISCPEAVLYARYIGVKEAKGELVLMLDSDQILEVDAVERGVKMLEEKNLDMLVLEEDVYSTDTFIEKLFYYDRKLIHAVKDFDPYTSVMLPRFYRTKQLITAFEKIPEKVMKNVGGQDHALIYYEMWQFTQKVDLLPNAVRHIEPNSLRIMWKKFYRWGATSVDSRAGKYDELITKKEIFRKGMFGKGLWIASLASILLLLIKGIPYKIGYYITKYK